MKEEIKVGDHVQVGLLEGPVMIVTRANVQDGKEEFLCGWYNSNDDWRDEWLSESLLAKV